MLFDSPWVLVLLAAGIGVTSFVVVVANKRICNNDSVMRFGTERHRFGGGFAHVGDSM